MQLTAACLPVLLPLLRVARVSDTAGYIKKQPISLSPRHLRGNECCPVGIGSLSSHLSYIISNVYATAACPSSLLPLHLFETCTAEL